jgi:hypothetical protein
MKRLLPILLLVFSVGVGADFIDYDGGTYTGKLRNGVRHGEGVLTWSDGKKYVGEFKGGKFHGQGTLSASDGRKYVGEWTDGKRHGHGTQYEKKGNVSGKALEEGTRKGYYAHIGEITCWMPRDLRKKVTGPLDCLRDVEGRYWNPSEGEGFYVFNDEGWRKISEMHGQSKSTRTRLDGEKYVGEWKYGNPLKGTEYDKNRNVISTWSEGDRKSAN